MRPFCCAKILGGLKSTDLGLAFQLWQPKEAEANGSKDLQLVECLNS